jgi:hypothetical protein
MDKERFEYLYYLFPWSVKPEDVEDYNEVHRIAGIAIKERFQEIFKEHKAELDKR